MFLSGLLMGLIALVGLVSFLRKRSPQPGWLLRWLPWAMFLPYLANSSGWILTEVGRQPWIVFGLLKTQEGASLAVSTGEVALSLAVFGLIYAALIVADVYLLSRYARDGAEA
jgi:cytochrome d ubiquinol oxidase subunit I